MKFPSIFKSRPAAGDHHHPYSTKQPWGWPSPCNHPKTLSFRAQNHDIIIDYSSPLLDGDSVETVVRGARSESRLFFEQDNTRSILDKSKPIESEAALGLKMESVIESIESANPYEDFRKSMGEMVERHGVRDWDGLEELLGWYLEANWKNNHRFIIGAFLDLLIHILLASSSSSSSFNSDSNYYTCTESCSCSASSLRSLDRSIRREVDEEYDHEIV